MMMMIPVLYVVLLHVQGYQQFREVCEKYDRQGLPYDIKTLLDHAPKADRKLQNTFYALLDEINDEDWDSLSSLDLCSDLPDKRADFDGIEIFRSELDMNNRRQLMNRLIKLLDSGTCVYSSIDEFGQHIDWNAQAEADQVLNFTESSFYGIRGAMNWLVYAAMLEPDKQLLYEEAMLELYNSMGSYPTLIEAMIIAFSQNRIGHYMVYQTWLGRQVHPGLLALKLNNVANVGTALALEAVFLAQTMRIYEECGYQDARCYLNNCRYDPSGCHCALDEWYQRFYEGALFFSHGYVGVAHNMHAFLEVHAVLSGQKSEHLYRISDRYAFAREIKPIPVMNMCESAFTAVEAECAYRAACVAVIILQEYQTSNLLPDNESDLQDLLGNKAPLLKGSNLHLALVYKKISDSRFILMADVDFEPDVHVKNRIVGKIERYSSFSDETAFKRLSINSWIMEIDARGPNQQRSQGELDAYFDLIDVRHAASSRKRQMQKKSLTR